MLSVKQWEPKSVLRLGGLVMCCLCFGSVLGGGALSVLPRLGIVLSEQERNLAAFVTGILSLQAPVLGLAVVFVASQGQTWREAFGMGNARLGQALKAGAGVGVIVLPAALLLGALASEALTRLGLKPESQSAVKMLLDNPPAWHIAIYGFGAVVLAPLAEEILFRGILYPFLKETWSPLAGWSISALLFACSHFNLMAFFPLAFLAVILTWLYERTDDLRAPILTHALFNGVNFYLLINPPAWAEKYFRP